MNEGKKTAIFAAVAVTSLLLAIFTRPQSATTEKDELGEMVNKAVFAAKFTDPDKAASLEISTYDETLGTLKSFEVAKDKVTKLWKIPSHDDYPADASEQVRDATTPLTDLKILAVVTSDRGEHAYYGVVEPSSEKLKVGDSGVGMMVSVKDESGAVAASLIIGKQDAKNQSQRYVRVPNQDPVYLVELTTTPFTSEFKKWIKGELLGVKSFDINSVSIRDYAITLQGQNAFISHTYDADCDYDTTSSKWSLKKLVDYAQNKPSDSVLAADEELKSEKLNELRSSVQSLEIADVVRKPKGLAADLKADKTLLENKESMASLYSQGFFPNPGPGGSTEILSSSGETVIATTEGVQYALRFGETLARLQNNDAKAASGETGLQRYLLVTTTVDESKFPQPELQKIPETIEEMLKLEAAQSPAVPATTQNITPAQEPVTTTPAASTDPAPAVEPTKAAAPEAAKKDSAETKSDASPENKPEASSKPADETAKPTEPDAKKESSEAKNESKDGTDGANPGCGDSELQDAASGQETKATESAQKNKPATDDAKPADATVPAQQNTAQPSTDGKPPEPTAKSEPKTETPAVTAAPAVQETPAAPAKPQASEEELKERLQATKERITKENQRKIDERNEKLEKAKKKVLELNARFSDWYYVVDDSMFKKLRITRADLVGKKGATEATPPPFPGGNPLGNLPGVP